MGSSKRRKASHASAQLDQRPSGVMWSWRAFALVGLALAAITSAVYFRALGHGFVQFDDPSYVTENRVVQSGLTVQGIRWAFTTFHSANWHPLTWISLMLDRQLYGLNPMGFHLTNLLLHIANSLLLLMVLSLMTRSLWKSAFVAALFAIHPLHVESVAWVAERKDVLSAFFWMLTMLAYWHYTRRPGIGRYVVVMASFALGLMSKPMLVSLPLMLLLMDWWPLGRRLSWRLLVEKAPLLLMSAASSFITMMAQRHGGAVVQVEQLPILVRASNAVLAYFQYLVYTVWPSGLSFFYTQIHQIPAVCIAALVLITAAALFLRRRQPYLAVGWLWYVVTLIPVIGLVQVGGQLMADRYTYIPLVGVFTMFAWGIPEILRKGEREKGREGEISSHDSHPSYSPMNTEHPASKTALSAVAAIAIIAILSASAWRQVSYWHDDATLCEHAIRINPANHIAHNLLGTSLAKQGRLDEALEHYETALKVQPTHAQTNNNIGIVLVALGRCDEAVDHYKTALRSYPDYREAHSNLGLAYEQMGRDDDAIAEYTAALDLDQNVPGIQNRLGNLLAMRKEFREAIPHFEQCLAMTPDNSEARLNLAAALYCIGDYAGAWEHVNVLRRSGVAVPSALADALSSKMPDPGR